MKMSVEIELDYIDEEGSLDEEILVRIQQAVTSRLTNDLSGELTKKIAERADSLVTAKVEMLINSILEKPITVSQGWNNVTEYESTFDMVETRMSKLYGERMDVSSGKCTKDSYLATVENYIENRTKEMLSQVEKAIKLHSDKAAKKAVNNNELIKAIGATVEINKSRSRETIQATIGEE